MSLKYSQTEINGRVYKCALDALKIEHTPSIQYISSKTSNFSIVQIQFPTH